MFALCIVMVTIEWIYSYRASDRAFDRVLASSALSIADTIEVQDGVYVDMPYSAFAILGISGLNRVFYRVAAPDGSLITGSPSLGIKVNPPGDAQPHFYDDDYRGTPVRLAVVSRFVSSANTTGWVSIFVAETREAREQLTVELLGATVTPVILVGAIAIFFVALAVHRAFGALKAIEGEIAARQASDLSPLKSVIPSEVVRLADAVDGFMERLSTTLDNVKHLTIDTGHQIQTPLAAIRAQAEVGLEEADSRTVRRRFKRIYLSASHLSELARDLLVDAKLVHQLGAASREPIVLAEFIPSVLKDFDARKGRPRRYSVSNVAKRDGTTVLGDRSALRELIGNLLDNALKHGKGPIDIQVDRSGSSIVVSVSDRGPGISDVHSKKVFDRFYRGDESKAGSGLGLSIAKTVAHGLGGDLQLQPRQGGGLTAALALPAAERSQDEANTDDT